MQSLASNFTQRMLRVIALVLLAHAAHGRLVIEPRCTKYMSGVRLAHPDECAKFVICSRAFLARIQTCPKGLHFNADTEVCDYPLKSGCFEDRSIAKENCECDCSLCCLDCLAEDSNPIAGDSDTVTDTPVPTSSSTFSVSSEATSPTVPSTINCATTETPPTSTEPPIEIISSTTAASSTTSTPSACYTPTPSASETPSTLTRSPITDTSDTTLNNPISTPTLETTPSKSSTQTATSNDVPSTVSTVLPNTSTDPTQTSSKFTVITLTTPSPTSEPISTIILPTIHTSTSTIEIPLPSTTSSNDLTTTTDKLSSSSQSTSTTAGNSPSSTSSAENFTASSLPTTTTIYANQSSTTTTSDGLTTTTDKVYANQSSTTTTSDSLTTTTDNVSIPEENSTTITFPNATDGTKPPTNTTLPPPTLGPTQETSNCDPLCCNQTEGFTSILNGNCQKFVVCVGGKENVFTCSNNLQYNMATAECDYPENVNCPWPQTPPSGPSAGPSGTYCEKGGRCVGQMDGNSFAIEAGACSPDYVICQCECEVKLSCPPPLVFNVALGICDWPENLGC